ncbi:dimethyl sulfoxide reductase anchor subunit family protein [Hwanghaeella sp.]|uniref:dimethyl sulfoxide reductase anchor subunit family protein n=1 Tax=Hwanghaeella sp. TaxID=2605943 RepID=UPI003CCC095E
MHPAKSVIFFTTASGAGYGLLIWFAFFSLLDRLPQDRDFALVVLGVSFTLVTAGLLSSTAHLGHPERAWRALSQWKTSWLSREGVAAILAYLPMAAYAYVWFMGMADRQTVVVIAAASIVLALVTIYCTAMIYASLKTIRAWHNGYTVAGYLVLGLMTGAVLLTFFAHLRQYGMRDEIAAAALMSLALGLVIKQTYWRFLENAASPSDIGTATGLGRPGKTTLLEGPHTESNYLMDEMGFRIARKHADKLRVYSSLMGFVLPIALIVGAVFLSGVGEVLCALAAVAFSATGVLLERWLFFAEARHVVTLYYGAAQA